jgi:hypothetical protein
MIPGMDVSAVSLGPVLLIGAAIVVVVLIGLYLARKP